MIVLLAVRRPDALLNDGPGLATTHTGGKRGVMTN